MICDTTTNNFYANFKWFQEFYQDLESLFESIYAQLHGLGYEGGAGSLFFSPAGVLPRYVPEPVFKCWKREDESRALVAAILSEELTSRARQSAPALLIVVHNSKNDSQPDLTKLILEILKNEEPKGRAKGADFSSFFVPLNAFSKDKIQNQDALDNEIARMIVEPLKLLLDKWPEGTR